MREIFGYAPSLIVFLHVFSAVLWVGGMVALRFALHPNLTCVENGPNRMLLGLQTMKKFFSIMSVFIVIIVSTAVLIVIAMDFKAIGLSGLVHAKETIWTIMTVNFIYMNIIRNKAQKLYESKSFEEAKAEMGLISSKLIPLNIALGICAIYLGVVLRGW